MLDDLLKWLYYFAFPLAMNESSCCSTFLPALDVVHALDFNHNDRCVVVYHCALICNFLMTYSIEDIFTFIFHLFIFDEVSYRPFGPFKLGLCVSCYWSFKSVVYFRPFFQICFCNIYKTQSYIHISVCDLSFHSSEQCPS